MSDSINQALGIDDEIQAFPQVYMPGENNVIEVDSEDDHEFTRRNVRQAIKDTQEAMLTAAQVAASTGSPKEIEAASKLLTSFVEANAKLLEMANSPKNDKTGEATNNGVINNTKNVFMVGNGDDLLKAVRNLRGESDEESTLQR